MEKIIIGVNKVTMGLVLVAGLIIGGAIGFGAGEHSSRGREGFNQGYRSEYGGRMMRNGNTNRAIIMERAVAAPTATTNSVPPSTTKPAIVPVTTTKPVKK